MDPVALAAAAPSFGSRCGTVACVTGGWASFVMVLASARARACGMALAGAGTDVPPSEIEVEVEET